MGKERETLLPAGRRALTPAIAFGAAGTIVTITQMTLLSDAVGRVVVGRPHLTSIGSLLLALLAVVVLRAVLAWRAEASAQLAALRLTTALRERLVSHLLLLGPAFVQRERSGELATTAIEGVDRLEPYYRAYLPLQALSLIVPATIILYLLRVDLPGALLLLVTAPIIPLLMVLVGSSTQRQVDRHWLALSRLGAQFLDTLQGLPTLLLFGRGDAAGEQVRAASTDYQTRTLAVLRLAFLSGMVLDIMTGMAIGLVAVVVAVQLLAGGLAFSSALLVLLLAPECYRPLQMLGTQRHTAMEGKAAGQRIAEILRTPAPVQTALPPTEGSPLPPIGASGAGVAGGAGHPAPPATLKSPSAGTGLDRRPSPFPASPTGTPSRKSLPSLPGRSARRWRTSLLPYRPAGAPRW